MIRRWDAFLAVGGLALFGFVASRIGWTHVASALVQAGRALAIIIGLSFLRLVLQTRAWSMALRADGIDAPQGELMLVRLASQGVGYLSVLGPVASEPMKIGLLRKSQVSAATATIVDTGVYWLCSGIVAIVGCLSAILLLAHRRELVRPLAVIAFIVAAVLLYIARAKPRLSRLADGYGAQCPRWLRKAAELEAAIRIFQRKHPRLISRMIWLDLACQLLLAAEVVAMLWCLGIPLRAITVLAVEGATRAIKMMAGWMPARIGADESGIAGAFLAFGLSPAAGLTLALARRSRDLLAALIGLGWLAWRSGFWKIAPVPAPEPALSTEA